jgi:Flp pilus assembly protein TadG
VMVLDTTPPAIVCPASRILEFQDENGAVASYVVTASDTCSSVSLAVTPASGSLFPIGVTPVQATATDGCTNTSQCAFTVTVLGAQRVKSNVLAELVALRSSVTLTEPFAQGSMTPYGTSTTRSTRPIGSTRPTCAPRAVIRR